MNPYSADTFIALSLRLTGKAPDGKSIWARSPYPLNSLVILSPISILPWRIVGAAWTVVCCGSLLAFLWALSSFAGLTPRSRVVFAALTLALAPLHTGIAVGNLSVPAIACIGIAIWAASTRRMPLPGPCSRAQPASSLNWEGVSFLYYLLRQRWRIVFWGAGVSAAILLIGIWRLELSGVRWFGDFLHNARGFAVDCSTCTFTDRDPIRFTLINLQVVFYSFVKSSAFANGAALSLSVILLGIWFWLSFNSSLAQSSLAQPEVLVLSSLAVLSLLPGYHRNYDATLLVFPLAWALSVHDRTMKNLSRLALLLMLPFAVPGPAILQEFALKGILSPAVVNGWWWDKLIMPHQIWLLLGVSVVLLYALAILRSRSLTEVPTAYHAASEVLP
jgi:hypothetical protein